MNLYVILYLTLLNLNLQFEQDSWKALPSDSIYHMADQLIDEYRYQEAIEKLNYLIANEEMLDPELKWKALTLIGYSHYFLGDYNESNNVHERALEIKLKPKNAISTLRSMGMNYKQLGLSGLALDSYLQALALNEEHNFDQKVQTELFNSISLLYLNMKDFERSIEYSQKTITQASSIGDTLLLAYGFNNIALNFHNLSQFDSSIYYHKLSLLLTKKSRNPNSIGTDFNNIGLNYLATSQYSLAKDYFDSANYYYHNSNNVQGKIIVKNNYGSYYLYTGNLPKAKIYLDSAYQLLIETPLKIHLIENLESQINYFEKLKDFQNAYSKQNELSIVQNQLFQDEVLNTNKIETTFILNKKESEKLVLELDAKLSRRLFALVLVVAIFLLTLASIYFSLSKKLKSKNAIIEIQKTDIIHRTSNVLTKVQAILKSISHGFEREEEKEKLRLAEAVIVSAGQLQEFTYGVLETQHEIHLDHYLQSLAQNVLDTFGHAHTSITLVFDMKKKLLTQEAKALNIGIIVSELILNAIKYAFIDSNTQPTIFLDANILQEKLVINVRDNGKGLPEKEKAGTGTDMIKKLVRQIHGTLDIATGEDGTSYRLTINKL